MSGKKGASQPMYYYVPVSQAGQAASAAPATPTYPAMPSWPGWPPAAPAGGVQYYLVPAAVAGASAKTAPKSAPRSSGLSFVDMTQKAKAKSGSKAVTVDLVSSSSDEEETPKKAKKAASAPAKLAAAKSAPKPSAPTKTPAGMVARSGSSLPPLPPLKSTAKPPATKAKSGETTIPSELMRNVYLGTMATRPISHIKIGPDSLMFYLVLPPNDHVLTLIISATAITKCRVHTEGAPHFVEVHAGDVNYFASQSVTMRSLCGSSYDPRSQSEPHRSLMMEFLNEVHPAMLTFLKGDTVKNVEYVTEQKEARRILSSHVATSSVIDMTKPAEKPKTTPSTAAAPTTQSAAKEAQAKTPSSAPAKPPAPLTKIPNFQPPRPAPLPGKETPKPTPAPASKPSTPASVTKPQSTPITKPPAQKPIPPALKKPTPTPTPTAAKTSGKSPIGSPGGRKVVPIEQIFPSKSPLSTQPPDKIDSLPFDFGGGDSSDDDLIVTPAVTTKTNKTPAPAPKPVVAPAPPPAPAKKTTTATTPAAPTSAAAKTKPTKTAPAVVPPVTGAAVWKPQGVVVIDAEKRPMRKARIVVEESGDSSSGSEWEDDEEGWCARKKKKAGGKVEVVVVDGDEGEKKEDEKKENGEKKAKEKNEGEADGEKVGMEKEKEKEEGEKAREGEKKEDGSDKMEVDVAENMEAERKEEEKKEGVEGEKKDEPEKMDVDIAEKEGEQKADETKEGTEAEKKNEGDKMEVDVPEKKEDEKKEEEKKVEGDKKEGEKAGEKKEQEKEGEKKEEGDKKEEATKEASKASDVAITLNGEAIVEEPPKEKEAAATVPVGEVLHLSDDEDTAEAQVPTAEAHTQEECFLSYPPDGVDCVTLFPSDLERLIEGEYLNDSLVEFYLKYLWRERTSAEQREKLHIFSTFFYNQLIGHSGSSARGAAARDRVQRWVKNVDIFSKEAVFIPICKDSHWFLAVILHPAHLPEPQPNPLPKTRTFNKRATQQTRCRIIIYDSMVEEDSEQPGLFRRLRRFLTQEWKRKRPTEPPREYTRHNVQCIFANVPTQDNDVDCGLFLLQYVEELLLDPVSNLDNFERPTWFSVPHVINTKRAQVRTLIHSLAARYNPAIGPVRPLTGPPVRANVSPPPSPVTSRSRATSGGKKTPAAKGVLPPTSAPMFSRPVPTTGPYFPPTRNTPAPVFPASTNTPTPTVTPAAKTKATTTSSPAMPPYPGTQSEKRATGRPVGSAGKQTPVMPAHSPNSGVTPSSVAASGVQKRAYSTRGSERAKEPSGKKARTDNGPPPTAPKTPPTSSLPAPSAMHPQQQPGGAPGARLMGNYQYPYGQYPYNNPYYGQMWYPPQQQPPSGAQQGGVPNWMLPDYQNQQQKR